MEVDRGRISDAEAQDQQWLGGIARGDRGALGRLYAAYHPRLTRFLLRHTRRDDLIDEIINETFWVVWRKAAEFRYESKVGTWIIGIAYRRMLKSVRDDGVLANLIDEGAEGAECVLADCESEQREMRDWVQRAVSQLPPDQRTTIELAYFLGQSCEEIADIMNCAVGTVKARMFHARMRLRSSLPQLADHRFESVETGSAK
jgi:RNA polymerase sigma-70 factor (ECF subfamily)